MVIGVLPNLDKHGATEIVQKMGKIFVENQITAYLGENIAVHPDGYLRLSEEELVKNSDVIITVGGDGTIIRYAKLAALHNKPVLGINAGRLGYLATLEANQLHLLKRLFAGNYTVEKRLALDVSCVENGKQVGAFTALNDAVITSGFMSRLIDIQCFVRGDAISYRADGFIVATPTGSTAYSMSAGGPVVDPTTQCMILTPICSHSLNAKPIILGADNRIRLKAYSLKRTDIYLSVDGRKSFALRPYTEVFMTRSKRTVQLIKLNDRSFYKTLSEKFKGGI